MCQTDDRQERLQQIAKIAVALEAQTGCPSPLLIAQWAIESSGAKSPWAASTASE
jgi:flagellum-specific peptidoglycan hydrolase FlgJ